MMPILLSTTFGAGVYLLYDGLTNPRPFHLPNWSRGVEAFLVRAGLRDVTPRDFVLFSLGAGLLGALFANMALHWPVVTVLAAIVAGSGPFTYYLRRHDRRRATIQAGLVDAIMQMRDSILAGLSMQEAVKSVAINGPECLRPDFSRLVSHLRVVSFQEAIKSLQERLAEPLFDTVAAALTINDRVGGRNVTQVLDQLAGAMRGQLRVLDEVRARQGEHRTTARIVGGLPFVALVLLRTLDPGYLGVFDTPTGQVVLGAGLLSLMCGYASMLWITRAPAEERVLPGEQEDERR